MEKCMFFNRIFKAKSCDVDNVDGKMISRNAGSLVKIVNYKWYKYIIKVINKNYNCIIMFINIMFINIIFKISILTCVYIYLYIYLLLMCGINFPKKIRNKSFK